MGSTTGPQTWRLFAFERPGRPCPNCGDSHAYLTHPVIAGMCSLLLFPPGTPGPTMRGHEVEATLAGTLELGVMEDALAYGEVAARVQEDTIRCERCGERFDDLEVYRQHACEVRYR
jgi:ribosomal protein S27AE